MQSDEVESYGFYGQGIGETVLTNEKLVEVSFLSEKYKRLMKVPFSSVFARICLPYVPLHAFTPSEGTKCFYGGHRHFSGYDSATCHIADDLRGALGALKHF